MSKENGNIVLLTAFGTAIITFYFHVLHHTWVSEVPLDSDPTSPTNSLLFALAMINSILVPFL